MVSIKKIFGSSDVGSHEDGGDLRHANPAGERSTSGKAAEAKSKNDELASRLHGKSSSDNVGHRKSLSNTSTTGLTSNTGSNSNRNSTTGYNTEADNTRSSPLGAGAVGAGAAGAGLGASSIGTAALGGSAVDRDSKKTSDILHATASDPHATISGDRPLVGAVPVHAGKEGSSTNNPEFVIPGGLASGPTHSSLPQTGMGSIGDSKRDNSNVESFTTPHAHDGKRDSALNTSSPPNLERTGTGRLSKSTSGRGFENPHQSGHVATPDLHEFDPKLATHDHQHLQHVTHREVRHVEVEEVERQREVDRHIHHVQTHVQPVLDKKVLPEKITENVVAPTKVHERHASTAEDVALFESLATQHRDTESHRPKERTVVDLGEKVVEKVHHHVHHVTQPVIEQEVVERHRIHTVIPVHHVTHEAPIIHKSSTHAPVALEDFIKGGGVLDSTKTYDNVGLLPDNDCERSVSGEAEELIRKLNLKTSGNHYEGSHAGHSHGTSSSSQGGYVSKDGDVHGSKVGQVVDNMTPSNNRVGDTQKI